MFYSQVHFLFCVWLTCLSGDDGKILFKNFSFLFHVFKWIFFFKGGFPNLPCVSGHLRVSLLLDDALFNISRSASMMFWPVCLLTPFFLFLILLYNLRGPLLIQGFSFSFSCGYKQLWTTSCPQSYDFTVSQSRRKCSFFCHRFRRLVAAEFPHVERNRNPPDTSE